MSWKEDLQEALRQDERNDSYRQWVRERVDTLKSSVTAHDILRHFGVSLRYSGNDQEEQISCPFHGKDVKPSARVFPEQGSSSSGLWCYVCQERWDVFNLWKKFRGEGEDTRFTQVLLEMERAFGIDTPEGPSANYTSKKKGPSEEELAVAELCEVCERRLRQAKPQFTMKGFLTIAYLLDLIRFRIENKTIKMPEAKAELQQILDKIGEKIRKRPS